MGNFKEEGGKTSLNCGTIRMITKRGDVYMEKRPDSRPTENAGGMKKPNHAQSSADKPSLTIKTPKPRS